MLSEFLLAKDDYEYHGKKIGEGSFGRVYEGTCVKTGATPVAVKIPKQEVTFYDWTLNFRELQMLATARHCGTLQMIGFYIPQEQGKGPVIVTPIMRNGTAGDALSKQYKGIEDERWNATAKSKYVFGVAAAMMYLHSRGIVHRDLKPGNVFLNDEFEPVIGDFGLSRMCNLQMTESRGSPLWMAPELIGSEKYNGKVDVYSYGVMLFQLFSGSCTLDDRRPPTGSRDVFLKRIAGGARLARVNGIPEFYWNLITQCWDQSPDVRPNFVQIVEGLQAKRESYAFPGCDLDALKAYEERVLAGVERVDKTTNTIEIKLDFSKVTDDDEEKTKTNKPVRPPPW